MNASVTCGSCGIVFGMPETRLVELRLTGDTFYCPNGHARHFTDGETREELKAKIACERERVALWMDRALEAERLRRIADRDRKTCPLCNLTLRGRNRLPDHLLERHGASKACRPLGLPAAGESSRAS